MNQPASLFISHGAPDLVLHNTAAKKFLEQASTTLGWPKAIIIVSAHFETTRPAVVSDPEPEMIYDFAGFDPKLRQVVYPAKGDPKLGQQISKLLQDAGIDNDVIERRGFDHGVWVPLSLLYSDANFPVVQLSVQPTMSTQHHYNIGVALRPLVDSGMLVIGSGALTHNLSELFSSNGLLHQRDSDEVAWARVFADWVFDKIQNCESDALINYREQAPFAIKNHPTEEHFLPLLVALGASRSRHGERLHKSTEFAILAMDAFAFH